MPYLGSGAGLHARHVAPLAHLARVSPFPAIAPYRIPPPLGIPTYRIPQPLRGKQSPNQGRERGVLPLVAGEKALIG